MSLFDDASLVYIPTGYKATKNYSGKPSTGGADMTFSRASGATRVNSKGLVEKVRTNNLLQSNQFDTAWTNTNSTDTGGQTGYDGSNDAWLIEKTASDGRIAQLISTGGVQTASLYAKAGTLNWISFFCTSSGGNAYLYFDLANGVKGSTGANTIDSTITSVGGGWYRISITFDRTLSSYRIYPADGDGDVSGTSGNIYVQDAQLEYGLVATNYIETTSAAVSVGPVNDEPRLTYDPVNPTAPSLLMEPQRTNLFEYSEYMNGLDFIQATATENAETSPEGVVNAARLYDNTTDAQHRVGDNAISVTSGTTYTLSVFAKKGTLRYCYLLSTASASTERYFFDLQEGTAITSGGTIEDYGNGWYRLSAQSTASATGTAAFAFNLTNEDQYNTYIGTGTDYHIVYGLQLEAGSYPTSYIPTNGTSVTRVVDRSFDSGLSNVIGQTEGVLFLDWYMEHESSSVSEDLYTVALSDGTSNNAIGINNYNNTLAVFVTNGGVSQFYNNSFSGSDGQRIKLALAYKENDFALYINGAQIATDSSGTIPSLTNINVASWWTGGLNDFIKLNKLLLFPTRLDNATLATLTSL